MTDPFLLLLPQAIMKSAIAQMMPSKKYMCIYICIHMYIYTCIYIQLLLFSQTVIPTHFFIAQAMMKSAIAQMMPSKEEVAKLANETVRTFDS